MSRYFLPIRTASHLTRRVSHPAVRTPSARDTPVIRPIRCRLVSPWHFDTPDRVTQTIHLPHPYHIISRGYRRDTLGPAAAYHRSYHRSTALDRALEPAMICPCCKRPLAGLRSPLTGRFLAHLHETAPDLSTNRVPRVASLCAAVAPFLALLVWMS